VVIYLVWRREEEIGCRGSSKWESSDGVLWLMFTFLIFFADETLESNSNKFERLHRVGAWHGRM
jgi:hypothetical protein